MMAINRAFVLLMNESAVNERAVNEPPPPHGRVGVLGGPRADRGGARRVVGVPITQTTN